MTVQGHDSFGFADPDMDNPRNYAQMGESEGYHDYNSECACFACLKENKKHDSLDGHCYEECPCLKEEPNE